MPVRSLSDLGPANQDAELMGPIYYDIKRGINQAKRLGDKAEEKRLNEFYKERLHTAIVESAIPKTQPKPTKSYLNDFLSSVWQHLAGN